MRFISMHATDKRTEAGELPSAEIMAGMGQLIGQMMGAGVFLAGEGLRPSSHGVRLNFSAGRRTITNGPFTGSNGLIDRYLIVQTASIDEAIEWATRFASVSTDAEIDIRPVTEPWDIGMMPRPAGLKLTRFMIMQKADKASEAGVPPSPQNLAVRATLMDDLKSKGALLSAETMQPSSKGLRVLFRGNDRKVIDGPFAESKELIGGFSILEVKSIDEAVEWATPFARLMGDIDIDIRPLVEG